RCAGDQGCRCRLQRGCGFSPSPKDLFEAAGRAEGLRRRQGQAAGADDAARQACGRAAPDRGQRVGKGPAVDAERDQRAASLPTLCHAAGRSLRRMEGARPQLHAAGFFEFLIPGRARAITYFIHATGAAVVPLVSPFMPIPRTASPNGGWPNAFRQERTIVRCYRGITDAAGRGVVIGSACRWTSFQTSCSKRKTLVTRRANVAV